MQNNHLLSLIPDTYSPSIDDNGCYVDCIPASIVHNSLFCPCSNKEYDSRSKFATHTKSKLHQKWLQTLNNNRANYYVELLKAQELISQQRKIIAQLEKDVHNSSMTINYLTQQLTNREKTKEMNLLDI